jgi:hypothetical protein
MSNIEMHQSNAILAINSLDRFINNAPLDANVPTIVSWLVATPTIITLPAGSNALVGATLTYPAGQNGWPAIGTVTILARVGQDLTINAPVTANSGGTVTVIQTIILNAGVNAQQPVSNLLLGQYRNLQPYCNNFTISSPGALIYGYIDRIVVSQIQLQYNIPTICFGRNDKLPIYSDAHVVPIAETLTIPFGFYTPDELAAAVQALITANANLTPLQLTVSYNLKNGFTFTSGAPLDFYFPSFELLFVDNFSQADIIRILKTYRTFGLNVENSEIDGLGSPSQISFEYPNFLYTPYIDIYSDILTNYQNIKDTNTSIAKPKGLVARILLAGVGNPQYTTETFALGSSPFVMTADLNTPKVIQWSRDVAVPSIDFQLRDCYGDLIPGDVERYPTEFQMTLLCIEG